MAERKLLLDTHALLWWATSDRALSQKVRRLMQDEATSVVVSAASAWEISTKVRLGRLTWVAQTSLEAYCAEQRFDVLPMTFAHAERAGSWTQDHGDPFDRMLAAQSEIEGLPLATNDRKISAFGIETIW
jgi:PIN domain nuclease of toxin-antitoxin system